MATNQFVNGSLHFVYCQQRAAEEKGDGEAEEQKRHMGLLLLVLGVGWVLIGVYQIVGGWRADASITGALVYYGLLFVLPGLAVAGIGYALRVWARDVQDYAEVAREHSRREDNEHQDT